MKGNGLESFEPSLTTANILNEVNARKYRKKGYYQLFVGVIMLNARSMLKNSVFLLSLISDLNFEPQLKYFLELTPVINFSDINIGFYGTRRNANNAMLSDIYEFISYVFLLVNLIGFVFFLIGLNSLKNSYIDFEYNKLKISKKEKLENTPKKPTQKSKHEVYGTPAEIERLHKQKMYLSTPQKQILSQKSSSLSDSRLLKSEPTFRFNLSGKPSLFKIPEVPKFNALTPMKKAKSKPITETNDEQAYLLLESLKVPWLGANLTVDSFIDDWTEKLKLFLRDFILDEVLQKFQKNCNEILKILLSSDFSFLGDSANIIKMLNFESEEDSHWEENELENLVQRCQLLVISTDRMKDSFNSLKSLILERKRLEKYFIVIRRSNDPHRTKSYVLKRLETLVNSGTTMPQFSYAIFISYILAGMEVRCLRDRNIMLIFFQLILRYY